MIAPFSWWIKDHIDHGREEMNFSEWGTYSDKRAHHKLEETVELVKEKEMPLDSYTWAHSEANLSDEQREIWRQFYEHFVFQADGDPGEHLPDNLRDVMGRLSESDRDQLIAFLRDRMKR